MDRRPMSSQRREFAAAPLVRGRWENIPRADFEDACWSRAARGRDGWGRCTASRAAVGPFPAAQAARKHTARSCTDRAGRTCPAPDGTDHACPGNSAASRTSQGLREGDRGRHWAEMGAQEAAVDLDDLYLEMQPGTSDHVQREAVQSLVQGGAGRACSGWGATKHHQKQEIVRPRVEVARSS